MITPAELMPVGDVNVEPGGSKVMKVSAATDRVKTTSTPTLMNTFLRIFVLITTFYFLSPLN